MLIIFDLDDTLVDTTRVAVPSIFRKFFRRLVGMEELRRSCVFDRDFHVYEDIFFKSNQTAPSAKVALYDLFESLAVPLHLFEELTEEFYHTFDADTEIEAVPGAINILNFFSNYCKLALVTLGDREIQYAKLKKAGLEPNWFSKLIVVEEEKEWMRGESTKGAATEASGKKHSFYKEILETLHSSPQETFVCGDRIEIDLSPAKRLGCHTVHFRNGRGRCIQSGPLEDADFSIDALERLKDIIPLGEKESYYADK